MVGYTEKGMQISIDILVGFHRHFIDFVKLKLIWYIEKFQI